MLIRHIAGLKRKCNFRFNMGYESYLRKRRISVSSRRKTSSFVTLVSSLSRLFACKIVDVFSFHLQIFHWFIADISKVIAREIIQHFFKIDLPSCPVCKGLIKMFYTV
jgi:hypothetical protein